MKLTLVCLISTLISVAWMPTAIQAQTTIFPPDPDFDDLEPGASDNFDITTSLLTGLVNSDLFQKKLRNIYDLIDLKVRFVRLVKSLLTRNNLILLRRLLDLIVRGCNFIVQFLPDDDVDQSKSGFLQALFPIINLSSTNQNGGDNNEINRINRSANNNTIKLTEEERRLLATNQSDVLQVARLIYRTP